MTQYSFFGVNGNGATGPASSISYGGVITMGLAFKVTSSGQYLYGYYVWRSDSGQSASCSCALWVLSSASAGTFQTGTSASTSSMVAGQWNYIPLATPFALSTGTTYKAVLGLTGNFNDTQSQFGGGEPYVNGITNGPITAFSSPVGQGGTNEAPFTNTYQGSFGTAGSDPTANLPSSDDVKSNFWLDILAGPAAANPSGQVQPAPTRQPRRRPARGAWRGTVPAGSNAVPAAVPGQVQPRATVPAPRRARARGVWHGPPLPASNAAAVAVAGQQPHGFTSARRPSGGWWGGAFTPQPNASGPSGTVQPRATVPVPRRYRARGQWRGQSTPQPHLPGTAQPRATVPVPRRTAARGQWQGQSTPQPHVPGQVQPGATVPVPRRTTARAVIASALGALNARGPLGTVQPRATIPVPRRTDARGTWNSALGPANAHGPDGRVQPHPVVARRETARAVARWTPVTTVNAAPTPPVDGQVQPAATAPHRPHAAQRVIWRGNAVPGVQPQPATGGLVRRRTSARGQWHSIAGSPPPSAPGTPVTGGTVKRRPPARGQWRGTVPATSNAHGPAVAAPKRRPDIPRRASARAVVRGTVVSTTNAGRTALFSLGRARWSWTAGEARQSWDTGRARQSWGTGRARNG